MTEVFGISTVAWALFHMPVSSLSYAWAGETLSQLLPHTPHLIREYLAGAQGESFDSCNLLLYLGIPGGSILSHPTLDFTKFLQSPSYLLVWCLECLPHVFVFCFSFAETSLSLDFRLLCGPLTSAPCLVEEKIWFCYIPLFLTIRADWQSFPFSIS